MHMRIALLIALWLGVAPLAHAHESSLAFLLLHVDGQRVEGRWDIAVRDLEDAVGLDQNGDAAITWAEFEARRSAVLDYAGARLRLAAGGRPCAPRLSQHSLDRHGNAPYAVLELVADCGAPVTSLTIDYTLLFDIDPTHRALLELSSAGRTTTAVLSRDRATQTQALAALSLWAGLERFIVEGIGHIWSGYDHLLFLSLLLLPAVLRPAASDRWKTVVSIVRVVTAFTLAHSVTLALAVYGLITAPPRLVEAVIAASIVVAGLLNLVPRAKQMGAALAFGFGLVHGLGFANALQGLGTGSRLVSLAGFNVGVEVGQLTVVAIAVPLLFALRRPEPLRLPALNTLSLVCAGIGSVWLVQRVL
jgi:hypothetical protein